MSLSGCKRLSETLREFEVVYTDANFVEEIPFAVSDYFRQDLQLMMDDAVVDNSEYAICENLVYPIVNAPLMTLSPSDRLRQRVHKRLPNPRAERG